jgi:hypothetical protein
VDDLNRRWRSCVANPTLDDPYITDGSEHKGGILWQRFHHTRAGYADVHIPQIVGHSSNCGPEKYRDNLWCIDSEGGVVGLLTHDNGETFEPVLSLPDDAQKPRYVRKWAY